MPQQVKFVKLPVDVYNHVVSKLLPLETIGSGVRRLLKLKTPKGIKY